MTTEFMTNSIMIDIIRFIAYAATTGLIGFFIYRSWHGMKTKKDIALGVLCVAMIGLVSILSKPSNQPKRSIDVPHTTVYKEDIGINTPEPRYETNDGFVPLKKD